MAARETEPAACAKCGSPLGNAPTIVWTDGRDYHSYCVQPAIAPGADQAAAKAMEIARQIVEDHIESFGFVPHPDKMKDAISSAYLALQKTANDGWDAFLESQGQLHEAEQRIKAQQQRIDQLTGDLDTEHRTMKGEKVRAEAAEQELAELRRALSKAAERFREYQILHLNKGAAEKALRNSEMADMCEKAILARKETP